TYQAANHPASPLDALSPSGLNAALVTIAQPIRQAAPRPISRRSERAPASGPTPKPANALGRTQPFEPEKRLIPAREFLMGSNPHQEAYARDDEHPQHRLQLPADYLAKTPVPTAQSRALVAATGRQAPHGWTKRTPPRGEEGQPMVKVSWYDARDDCRWLSEVIGRGYGLASEAEREKAARDTDGRLYPGGDRWDAWR